MSVLLASVFLFGCRSAKPPPPQPPAVAAADRAATRAEKASAAQDWTAAARAWQSAADRYALLNDQAQVAIAWHNLAQAQRQLGRLQDAQQTFEQAASLNEKLGKREAWWCNQIALLQTEAEASNTNALRQRFEHLLPVAGSLTNRSVQALFRNELGLWQIRQGAFEKAALSLDQAKQDFKAANDLPGIATITANQARLAEAEKNYAAAIDLWSGALLKFQALAEPHGITAALAGLGRSSLAAGTNLAAAEDYLRRAAANYRTLNSTAELANALELLAKTLTAEGKNKEAEAVRTELQKLP